MRVNKNALKILEKLNEEGFEAFVVGGCVRDSLLGKEPKDWDICTNAKPLEIMQVFEGFEIIPTGLQHGTLTLMLDSEGFEVTTYRVDGEYSDGRRPDNVEFTSNLREDLSRRDFTINSMAYNPIVGLIDYFGGQVALENGLIECVGNPHKRFEEDALRVMRALRFSSVLGYKIEENTSNSLKVQSKNLVNISKERLSVELVKMLNGKGVLDVLLNYKEVLSVFIPELALMFNFNQNNKYHKYDIWEHSCRVVDSCKTENSMLRVAGLFHDIGKPESYSEESGIGHFYGHAKVSKDITEKVLKDLKFSTSDISLVLDLIQYHDVSFSPTKKFILRMLNKLGESKFRLLLDLRDADIRGQGYYSEVDSRVLMLHATKDLLDRLELQDECFTLKHLAINGNDLQSLGYTPGKELGIVLKTLLDLVLDNKVKNEKGELLCKAGQYIKK